MGIEKYELISNGSQLNCQAWIPETEPRGIICLVHGLGEHIGRYEEFAAFFTENAYAVFAFDLWGHGKSPGKRGHIKQYDWFLNDLESLLKIARREYNDTPIFLYGQSMGGNIISSFITRRNTSEVSGAVLSAPWLKLAFDPPAFKVKLAGFMRKIYPSFRENSNIDPALLSKDEQVIKAYDEDPLVQRKISANLFFSVVKSGVSVIDNAFKLTIPLLAIHGKSDQLTSWKATEQFVKNAGDKARVKLYENVLHEPHNDLERDEILQDVLNWMNELTKVNQ